MLTVSKVMYKATPGEVSPGYYIAIINNDIDAAIIEMRFMPAAYTHSSVVVLYKEHIIAHLSGGKVAQVQGIQLRMIALYWRAVISYLEVHPNPGAYHTVTTHAKEIILQLEKEEIQFINWWQHLLYWWHVHMR